MPIELPDDLKKRVFDSLQAYVKEHFDHDIGLLQTELFFEHLIGMMGATIYNQGVDDAQAYMQLKLIDMEIELHEHVEWGGRD